MKQSGNAVCQKWHRGFESPPFRYSLKNLAVSSSLIAVSVSRVMLTFFVVLKIELLCIRPFSPVDIPRLIFLIRN